MSSYIRVYCTELHYNVIYELFIYMYKIGRVMRAAIQSKMLIFVSLVLCFHIFALRCENLIAHNVDCLVETVVAWCSVSSGCYIAGWNWRWWTVWDACRWWCWSWKTSNACACAAAKAWGANVAWACGVNVWWSRWIVACVTDCISCISTMTLGCSGQTNTGNTQRTVNCKNARIKYFYNLFFSLKHDCCTQRWNKETLLAFE